MITSPYNRFSISYPFTAPVTGLANQANVFTSASKAYFGASLSTDALHTAIKQNNTGEVTRLLQGQKLNARVANNALCEAATLSNTDAMVKLILAHTDSGQYAEIVKIAVRTENVEWIKTLLKGISDRHRQAAITGATVEVAACFVTEGKRCGMVRLLLEQKPKDERMAYLTPSALKAVINRQDLNLTKLVGELMPERYRRGYFQQVLDSAVRTNKVSWIQDNLNLIPQAHRRAAIDHALPIAQRSQNIDVYNTLALAN